MTLDGADNETEIPLGGGRSVEGVVRVGDTVRRPPVFATQLMRDVLVHLERVGFESAPRWLGMDEQGRDMLSWVDGDTFSDCRAVVWGDEQLVASARLLRLYHDAVAGSALAGASEVVCHGDFGPWNLIWRDELPFCIIDFDNARPGPRADDLGYALWKHLNLGLVDLPPKEQGRRARGSSRRTASTSRLRRRSRPRTSRPVCVSRNTVGIRPSSTPSARGSPIIAKRSQPAKGRDRAARPCRCGLRAHAT